MVTRHGLEAWLKGTIVLTCYANSTSQTQIIPSLISRLAQVSGPANDSTGLRDCKVHGDASGRTCYKPRQTGCTNPAYQILRQDLLGAHLVHTHTHAHCTRRGGVSRPGRGPIRGSCSALGLATVMKNSIGSGRGSIVYPEHL